MSRTKLVAMGGIGNWLSVLARCHPATLFQIENNATGNIFTAVIFGVVVLEDEKQVKFGIVQPDRPRQVIWYNMTFEALTEYVGTPLGQVEALPSEEVGNVIIRSLEMVKSKLPFAYQSPLIQVQVEHHESGFKLGPNVLYTMNPFDGALVNITFGAPLTKLIAPYHIVPFRHFFVSEERKRAMENCTQFDFPELEDHSEMSLGEIRRILHETVDDFVDAFDGLDDVCDPT